MQFPVGRKIWNVELRIRTPHGAVVPGAFVRATASAGPVEVRERMAGRYSFCASLQSPLEVVIEAHANGFDFQTFRGIIHASGSALQSFEPQSAEGDAKPRRSNECVLVGGPSVLGTEIVPKVTRAIRDGNTHVFDVVLDYEWFTSIGFPPTLGNRVELLVDGEVGWGSVAQAITNARSSIRIATWVYDPSMELLRPDPLAEPAARAPYTIHRMLERRAAEGALVQLLLWDPPLLPMPRQTRTAACAPGDGFEVLCEKNPTQQVLFQEKHELPNRVLGGLPIGSYHQKTAVIDGRIGFCGGMNLKQNDWDTRWHRIFDPARCRFSRPRAFRQRVRDLAEPADHPPRHDFMARLEGPAVMHLEENFRQRWNRLMARGALYADLATPIESPRICDKVGSSAVQVVRTMPAPFEERGILDVWLRAIRAAKKLIYVEDQYFRSVLISEAIAATIQKNPQLGVIAITSEAHANQPLTGQWSRVCFDIIRAVRPDFELYALHVLGVDCRGNQCVLPVDNHGKLLIVDDVFLMVGSCNVNDRGLEYEGECNIAVVDPEFVARARLDLFRDYLDADPRLGWNLENDVRIFSERAAANHKRVPVHHEHAFVVPFVPRPRRRMIFDRRVF